MASKMNAGFAAMIAKKKEGTHTMPDGKKMKDSAMKMAKPKKMANGGSTSSRADGVAQRGRTPNDVMVTGMKRGGSCK